MILARRPDNVPDPDDGTVAGIWRGTLSGEDTRLGGAVFPRCLRKLANGRSSSSSLTVPCISGHTTGRDAASEEARLFGDNSMRLLSLSGSGDPISWSKVMFNEAARSVEQFGSSADGDSCKVCEIRSGRDDKTRLSVLYTPRNV